MENNVSKASKPTFDQMFKFSDNLRTALAIESELKRFNEYVKLATQFDNFSVEVLNHLRDVNTVLFDKICDKICDYEDKTGDLDSCSQRP